MGQQVGDMDNSSETDEQRPIPANTTRFSGDTNRDHLVHSWESKDVSLRHWLDNPERVVDGLEC